MIADTRPACRQTGFESDASTNSAIRAIIHKDLKYYLPIPLFKYFSFLLAVPLFSKLNDFLKAGCKYKCITWHLPNTNNFFCLISIFTCSNFSLEGIYS